MAYNQSSDIHLNNTILRKGARFVKLRSWGEYVIGDGRKLPFKSNSFDLVTCTQVIEHLRREEQLSFIAELKRVLRKGGYIYDVSNVQAETSD